MDEAGDGIELARDYYVDLVAPLLRRHLPHVRYAAARVGPGSDVLGLDDVMSRDHDWGLRLQVFVHDRDRAAVLSALDQHLPVRFRGHPVRFGLAADPADAVRIDVTSVSAFARRQLGFDPSASVPSVEDWLSLTGQAALEVVSGAVFEDQTGELTALREAVAWYPDDVWRYVVACDWQRLDQELPLVGRAGDRGDELGSRTIAARLVDVAVHLAFMLSRSWPPYSKWRGTVLGQLPGCAALAAGLDRVLDAHQWQDRQSALADSLAGLLLLQRQCGLPTPASATEPFHDRPYIHLSRALVPALLESLRSNEVKALTVGVGSVEQQTDNVDVLTSLGRRRALSTSVPLPPASAGPHSDLIHAAAAILNPRQVGDRLFGDVAAQLVTSSGRRFQGVCIDTGSGTGFCAEHSAIAAMVTAGEYAIDAIVAVWRDGQGRLFVLPPCGRCREFIRQVDPANIDTRVVLGYARSVPLRELLPAHEWPAPLAGD